MRDILEFGRLETELLLETTNMGQEASMPVPEGQEADYQHSNNNGTANTTRTGPRAAKAIGNMIRRGHEGVEYNDRETARAAAAGGHFSMASTDSEHYPASQMTPAQQQAYIMAQTTSVRDAAATAAIQSKWKWHSSTTFIGKSTTRCCSDCNDGRRSRRKNK